MTFSLTTIFPIQVLLSLTFSCHRAGSSLGYAGGAATSKFDHLFVNLLHTSAAREQVEPAPVANREAGSRFQLSIWVENVDAVCALLEQRGVAPPHRAGRSRVGHAHRDLHRPRRPQLGNRTADLSCGGPIAAMPINIFTAENTEGRIDVARALDSAETAMYIYDLSPGQVQSPYHARVKRNAHFGGAWILQ